jgi:hypothetical protein
MRKLIALALVAVAATPVWAKGKSKSDDSDDDDEETSDDSGDDDESSDEDKPKKHDDSDDEDDSSEDEKPKKSEKKETSDEDEPKKQDLTGHDLGTKKKVTEFEKNRFFVDKVDSDKTEDHTLIQGSLSSTSFLYNERGGSYGGTLGNNYATYNRMFTDLRLQTDFRHISGGRWEGRIDGRLRFVNSPPNDTLGGPADHVQSGLTGQNEYDLRELWLVRNGERSDVFIGRQFIPDLGGLKIDGVRVDYAANNKLTYLMFAGLYPLRGSRSLTTDYIELKDPTGLNPAGKYVASGGFGGAYRTVNAYGSIGGVALAPLTNKEQARFYVTSSGYYRAGSKLDFYHFALVDLVGSAGFQLTNLSAGINAKPDPRLRLTASFNRNDTETLNVQAGAFLNQTDQVGGGPAVIQNESYLLRIATNEARAGVSAALGSLQRFWISTAITYRERPAFTLKSPNGVTLVNLDEASSVDVWASIVDHRSIKDMKLGIDGSQTFGVGQVAFQRTKAFNLRVFGSREFKGGRGEWQAEAAYTTLTDTVRSTTTMCALLPTSVPDCFGYSNATLLSFGGQIYYRLNADWFGIVSAYATQIKNKRADLAADPNVLSLTGFLRIAYRF